MPRTRNRSAAETARALKVDPFKYLCEQFNKMPDDKVSEKIPLALELMPYCYPKLKAVEHSASDDQIVTITIGGVQPNEVIDHEPTQLGFTESEGGAGHIN